MHLINWFVKLYYLSCAFLDLLTVMLVVHYRLTAHFIVQVGQGELWKQWTWEPRMGESLILSLVDPNDLIM